MENMNSKQYLHDSLSSLYSVLKHVHPVSVTKSPGGYYQYYGDDDDDDDDDDFNCYNDLDSFDCGNEDDDEYKYNAINSNRRHQLSEKKGEQHNSYNNEAGNDVHNDDDGV